MSDRTRINGFGHSSAPTHMRRGTLFRTRLGSNPI